MAYTKNKKNTPEKKWTDITGKMHIFMEKIGEKFRYSTSIGNRKPDGSWDNMYLDVQFKKDADPEDAFGESFDISINSGFLTFRSFVNAEGKTVKRPKIVVMDYEV